uniref:Band 7 domain-containing protein n=1 Tax=Euplotes harpa TaxID=151035 RepID=A0A7S3N9L6_9SPIT|mmetsp:Transcript_27028/g.31189  ORF Transcript_27028/g.31189 Transcript_27028/m.31189 type:complete len:251 (+) Transcript_27028:141-893(+)
MYTSGIHLLGVGHSFIKYPTTVQTYEFSKAGGADAPNVRSRTKDGLEVELEISFQYIYIPNKIYNLYMRYADHDRTPCKKIAIDILTDVATQYNADQFFFSKDKISGAMQKELNTTFSEYCFSTVDYFQLKSIDLPDKYEIAIQETEVKRQDIHKAEAEKQKMQIELETKIMQAEIASNININKAEGDASTLLQANLATSESFYKIQNQQALALAEVKRALGLSSPQLLTYLRAKILKEYPEEKMIIGLD